MHAEFTMSEKAQIQLEVVTPARAVFKQKVDEVVLPGADGQLGILPDHLPLITALGIGVMIIKDQDKGRTFFVDGGFAEIRDNIVTVLTEDCQGVDEIDVEHARRLLHEAETNLSSLEERSKKEDVEENALVHHRKMLERAQVRLLMSDKSKN